MPFSEFVLLPDDDPEDATPCPARLVSSGLAPTSDVPASARTGRDTPPCFSPCATCGQQVLHVSAPQGPVVLHPPEHGGPACYVVQWDPGTPQPRASPSRALAVHQCGGGV
jgi:hypothetical protein